jgi:hypothetical protein
MLAIPRQLRIQYEGATYHLMSRGDRREEIFRDDPFSINAISPNSALRCCSSQFR